MTQRAGGVASVAESVFGDRLPLAQRLADWLTGAGITRGVLGPREADQIWERHLLNGVGLGGMIRPDAVVIDLGSGAGLPGLPLLLARPDLRMVLVEPKARRVEFLREVCADLGLAATVIRARATTNGLARLPEGASGQAVPPADAVIARAVASLADLAGWAAPLLLPGGKLFAVKGSTAAEEVRRDGAAVRRLSFSDLRVSEVEPTVTVLRTGEETGTATGSRLAATVIEMTLGRVSRET